MPLLAHTLYATQPLPAVDTTDDDHMIQSPTPFACDMTAIAPPERQTHLQTIDMLFRSVLKISELPNGYSFSLPQDDEHMSLVVAFISRERLCCPFFDFALRVEDMGRTRQLDVTGPPGVKPFIIAELGGHIDPPVRFPGQET